MSLWIGRDTHRIKAQSKCIGRACDRVCTKHPHWCHMTRAYFACNNSVWPVLNLPSHFPARGQPTDSFSFDRIGRRLLHLIISFSLWYGIIFAVAFFFFACACHFFIIINLGVCLIFFPWFVADSWARFYGPKCMMNQNKARARMPHMHKQLLRLDYDSCEDTKTKLLQSTWSSRLWAVVTLFLGSFKSRVARKVITNFGVWCILKRPKMNFVNAHSFKIMTLSDSLSLVWLPLNLTKAYTIPRIIIVTSLHFSNMMNKYKQQQQRAAAAARKARSIPEDRSLMRHCTVREVNFIMYAIIIRRRATRWQSSLAATILHIMLDDLIFRALVGSLFVISCDVDFVIRINKLWANIQYAKQHQNKKKKKPVSSNANKQ